MEESSKRNKKKKAAKGKGKKVAKGKKVEKRKEKTPAAIRGELTPFCSFSVCTYFRLTLVPPHSAENARQQARLIASQRFERTISGFTRAIHLGIFDIRHSSLLLKYWGLLGSTFDDFARLLMHDLRDEGNYGDGGDVVASVIIESLQGVSRLSSAVFTYQ
jgi:cohesin complex subunit SA-1/2